MLGLGATTPQVLGEFFVNAVRKPKPPLTVEEASERIENHILTWEVMELTGQIVMEAARGFRKYDMPYWDAQIWASARLNQIPVIFSKDFNTGTVIEGVRFENPLSRDFDLKTWTGD